MEPMHYFCLLFPQFCSVWLLFAGCSLNDCTTKPTGVIGGFHFFYPQKRSNFMDAKHQHEGAKRPKRAFEGRYR